MRMERFELSWVSPPPPQDGVSASSTTSAIHELKLETQTKGGLGDLNPHAFRRHPLKMVCLPVPPLPHLVNYP